MMISRRTCLLSAVTTLFLTSACKYSADQWRAPRSPGAPEPPPPGNSPSPGEMQLIDFVPEMFGAAGDGVTNDTDAFAQMTRALNGAGGGSVILSNTTYVVGKQGHDPNSPYAFAPAPIMDISGCTKDVKIFGNGAKIKSARGLRFGTFDALTGLPTVHSMPYYAINEVACPYFAMITVQNCSGKVYIENLELDGNLAELLIGGQYGDTGWQIPGFGLRLINNSGGEHIVNLHTHHHPVDGLYVAGTVDRTESTVIENSISEYNARQGCTIGGGSNFRFEKSHFNHTGRAGLMSAPGAGIDIEAELNPIRNIYCSDCQFSNNSGCGMVADSGDTDGAIFDGCSFVGTTTYSAWPRMPHFKFVDCQFVGSICNTFADVDPDRAARFSRCNFLDDVALSPTNEVYGDGVPIADLGSGDRNVLFDDCVFRLTNKSVLPWSGTVTYNNCTMSQVAPQQSYPRGIFTGTNKIDGNVGLNGSKILGELIVNGQVVPRTG